MSMVMSSALVPPARLSARRGNDFLTDILAPDEPNWFAARCAATVTASVYTGWGTKDEKMETLSFRLDKPKDKHLVGEVKVD